MRVFTKRNAVLGWIVARVARRRLERRLNAVAGNPRDRRRVAVASALAAGAAIAAGALVARRAAADA